MQFSEQPIHNWPDLGANQKLPLVVIVGPTAVGKSELAIQLAERFDGEIVSADSRLFYRGMDIGTAKPSAQDLHRVPHHLINVSEPDETWSLAIFQREAHKVIGEICERKHLPFLVGGTGQFIKSVLEGWSPPAVEPNPQLRIALDHWSTNIGPYAMHAKLAILDPTAAEAIDYQNLRRTIRALEVVFSTGRRFSDQKKTGQHLYKSLIIGLSLPRHELYKRIDDRIENMLDVGLVEEVSRLLEQGYSPELPTMSAIGYGEIVSYLEGELSLEDAVVSMKRRTRDFVRRQTNWFKMNDPEIHWFQAGQHTPYEIEKLITEWRRSE